MNISIIIRTKDEARWLGSCLRAIERQTYKKFEIVVVDNNSADASCDIAAKYGALIVEYNSAEYRPGAALNKGILAFKADAYVFLSAHCIPVGDDWLQHLVQDLAHHKDIAGVYGRQIPVAYSSDEDKRDLLITFGLDPHLKSRDPFFHNANSIIKHDALYPDLFDEEVTNIEDRIWAQNAIMSGWKIYYSARSDVRHFHGIHQRTKSNTRSETTLQVLRTMNSQRSDLRSKTSHLVLCIKDMVSENDYALDIIGLRKLISKLENISLHVFAYLKINIYHPKNFPCASVGSGFNSISVNFIERQEWMSEAWVSIPEILGTYLQHYESHEEDMCIYMDHKYLYRRQEDIHKIIEYSLGDAECDTVIFHQLVNGLHFTQNDYVAHKIAAEIFMPRSVRKQEGIASKKVLQGYGSMFKSKNIIDGSILGESILWLEPASDIACIRFDNKLEYDEIYSASDVVW